MKPYGLLWLVIGTATGVYLTQETSAPQSFGIDPGSLWEQYAPLILGVALAIVNNGDWPDWLKRIINQFAKDKGADIDKGNKVLTAFQKVLEALRELELVEGVEPESIEYQKDVAAALYRKLMDGK